MNSPPTPDSAAPTSTIHVFAPPDRRSAQRAAESITEMMENSTPGAGTPAAGIAQRETRVPSFTARPKIPSVPPLPAMIDLKFYNGVRSVEVSSLAVGALAQGMIDKIQGVMNTILEVKHESGHGDSEITFDIYKQLNDVLFDVEKQARKAQMLAGRGVSK